MGKRGYFVGPVFAVGQSVTKTMKTGPLDNFPLYCNNKEAIHSSHKIFNLKFLTRYTQ